MQRYFNQVFTWLFILSSHLGVNLQFALYSKFPGVCPYCLKESCVCIITDFLPSRNISDHEMNNVISEKFRLIRNTENTYNFDNALKNINSIYGVISRIMTVNNYIIRLHEGIADISKTYRSFQNGNVSLWIVGEKISEVFVWLLIIWQKVFRDKSLDAGIKLYFSERCPECLSFPCICFLEI